jgi:hypothetical protein
MILSISAPLGIAIALIAPTALALFVFLIFYIGNKLRK